MIQTSAAFEACLPHTLKEEGGNSNDPHDPGGRTHKGIIQREYDRWRKSKGLSLRSVYVMTDDEVREIYWTEYWLPHCPALPRGLDLSFFDNAVNEGPREAIVLLQRTLLIHDDGLWGAKTTDAIAAIPDLKRAIRDYAVWRQRFYRGLRSFHYFGSGWTQRVKDIEEASLAMVREGQANVS